MAFKIVPVAHRILVEPEQIKKQTESGIIIDYADNEELEKNARVTGRIVAIGEDAWAAFNPKSKHAGLKVGDLVYYAKYAGKPIRNPRNGAEYVILNDEDVVAKVEEK